MTKVLNTYKAWPQCFLKYNVVQLGFGSVNAFCFFLHTGIMVFPTSPCELALVYGLHFYALCL